jgi:hypothetical protein
MQMTSIKGMVLLVEGEMLRFSRKEKNILFP